MPALTAHSVEKIKPADARAEIVDALVPGLRLVVQPTGVKSWALRYSFGRRHHKMTIGRYPKISLSDARDAARDALQRLARGVDPSTGPRSGVAVDDSFAAAVADYKTLHVAKLRPATIYYVTRELDTAVEAWRGQPLKSIRRADVIALVDEAAKRGPNAGNCCLQVMAAFFSWCESRDLIEASPTNGVRRVAKAPVRDRVLDDAELLTVWLAADKAGGTYGGFCQLLILTGCRRNELASLERDELKADAIELPAKKVKTGEAHEIPLTPLMRRILDTLPKSGRYVLTGCDHPVSNGSKTKDAIETPSLKSWTFHDLRRSFATGMGDLGILPHVIERCLNHKLRGVAGVYNRAKLKSEVKEAFERWSAHVESLTR